MAQTQEEVFQSLRALLAARVSEDLFLGKDEPGSYHLYERGDFTFGKRQMKEIYFVGLEKNKDDVVLHYLPLYMNAPLGERLDPILMKKLKGKTCFHFKDWNAEMESAVNGALDEGLADFRKAGGFA